jgi:hypothetical protein
MAAVKRQAVLPILSLALMACGERAREPTVASSADTAPSRENPLIVRSGVKDGNRWQLVGYVGDPCHEHGLPEQGMTTVVELREFNGSGWDASGGGWCDVPDKRAMGEPVIHRGAIWGLTSDRVATVRVEVVDHTPISINTIDVAIDSRPFAIYFTELPKGAHVVQLTGVGDDGRELEHQEFPADGPPADYTDPTRPG